MAIFPILYNTSLCFIFIFYYTTSPLSCMAPISYSLPSSMGANFSSCYQKNQLSIKHWLCLPLKGLQLPHRVLNWGTQESSAWELKCVIPGQLMTHKAGTLTLSIRYEKHCPQRESMGPRWIRTIISTHKPRCSGAAPSHPGLLGISRHEQIKVPIPPPPGNKNATFPFVQFNKFVFSVFVIQTCSEFSTALRGEPDQGPSSERHPERSLSRYCSFPEAAVTKHHGFGGLKWHICSLSFRG